MFYEDLSPYRYNDIPTGLPGVFNIGWLSSHVPISHGDVDAAAKLKLAHLADPPVFLKRGFHTCDLCGEFRGSGEIWIPGDDGHVYASPSMLLHYIETHNYLPPALFLEALHRAKAAVSEADCYAKIATQRHKLNTAPTPQDILVPYYSVKVFWKLSDFRDLTAFVEFIGTALPWRFNHFAVDDIGYFVRTACEEPDQLLREIVAELQPSKPTPFQCRFNLLYVGGDERVCSNPVIEKPAQ